MINRSSIKMSVTKGGKNKKRKKNGNTSMRKEVRKK